MRQNIGSLRKIRGRKCPFDNSVVQKERAVSDEMALIKNVNYLYVYELILISTFHTVRPS